MAELPHVATGLDGSLMPCTCPRRHDHGPMHRTPNMVIASNHIAAAVESVQGFTVLDVRYAIADEVLAALIALGWREPGVLEPQGSES